MKKKKDIEFKKSYESDGLMGTDKKKPKDKKQGNDKDDALFFNITESSE